MLSRVAENIYWVGRYVERAENTARLTNTTTNLLLDLPRGIALGWAPLVNIMGVSQEFYQNFEAPSERNVLRFLICDERNSSSITRSLAGARENARTLRDVLPREAWEQINDSYLYVQSQAAGGLGRRSRFDLMRNVILRCQTIVGLLGGTMSHDEAYQFSRLGRNLERADMTTRIVDVSSADLLPKQADDLKPYANIRWMTVLKSLTAYQMYRQHVQVRVKGPDVLRFLLQDRFLPRAVVHCLGNAATCLQGLPNNDATLRTLGRVRRRVDDADVYTLATTGLHEFIDDLQLGLNDIHVAIAQTYFGLDLPVAMTQAQG